MVPILFTGLLAGIVLFLLFRWNEPNVGELSGDRIKTIVIEDLGNQKVIKISKKEDIQYLISMLEVGQWMPISEWKIQYAPNLFIKMDEDTLIGLYGLGEPYAQVKIGKRYKHYSVPTHLYDEINSFLLGMK